MTSSELKEKLIQNCNRTPEQIDEIIAKFEKSAEMRKALNFQFKSSRQKINEFMKDRNLDHKDCRFFWWHPGVGIFVHRNVEKKTATVTFSFLNPNDAKTPGFKYDIRACNYYALLNYASNRYTYEVEWRGRSEFAVYDAFVKNHYEFPNTYRDLVVCIDIFKPRFEA